MTHTSSQRGNAFLFVLLGVVLFAALAFTVSRSMQSSTATKMSAREMKLAVSNILNYAQRVERAVDRVRRNGCSENDISFENNFETGYTHAPDVDNKCKVFNPDGGNLSWYNPPVGTNDGTGWFFLSNGIRTFDNASYIGTTEPELTLILKNIDNDLCDAINEEMDAPSVWEAGGLHNGGPTSTVKFIGTFTGGSHGINNGNSWPIPATGCFCDGSASCAASAPRYFYHAILIR